MDLYTSLVRLKQALNNGQLPPMTPLPKDVRAHIDPDFTINGDGWGGLVEDEMDGLRCPVRRCGRYFHRLATHLDSAHADIGGANGLRALMGIPTTAPLLSQKMADGLSISMKKNGAALVRGRHQMARLDRKAIQAKGRATMSQQTKTVGYQNLGDTCPAQFVGKVTALHAKLGRTPTQAECVAEYGSMIAPNAKLVFGSWNAAIAFCGIEPNLRGNIRRTQREEVLASLNAWIDVHGDLPTSKDAACADRVPMIIGYKGILRGLGAATWTGAMRIAAALLDIRGGRYGLPERQSNAA